MIVEHEITVRVTLLVNLDDDRGTPLDPVHLAIERWLEDAPDFHTVVIEGYRDEEGVDVAVSDTVRARRSPR